MSQTIILKHSTVKDKLPSSAQYGEIFVNFHSENPFLATLNNQGQFEKFLSENKLNELYYNKSQVNDIVANLESGGTIDFDDYYKKNEVDTLLQGKSDTGHTHSYTALTDLPDLSIYLTEHQDISYLATKQELESYQSISGMSSYLTVSQAEQDFQPKGDYVAPSDLDDYLTIASASTIYATKEELEEHIPTVDAYTKAETDTLLAGKANSAHTHTVSEITDLVIPSLEGYATEAELANYQPVSSMTDYALVSQIPSVEGLASETWVSQNYQPKGTYVVPSDLNNYVTSGYAEETFAKKGDVPTDVYTKSETDTLLAGKANSAHTHTASEIIDLDVPKIWKGTLAEYTNLTEIDSDTLYVITDESEQLVTSGEVESMISGFTNLTEVQTLLEGYSTTAHTHDYSEIENTPDLSGFASLSDIPDTSNFVTSAFTEDHYQPKGTYVVPSDLDDYALKTDLPTVPDSYTKTEADNLLAGKANSAHTHTVSEITDLVIPSLEGYATEAELANYQPVSAMSEYSTTAHTHSYTALTDLPDLSIYLTEHQDISGLATKQELENYMPNSGMTDYALKSEIPSIEGLASETWVTNNFAGTGHTHSQYLTETSADTRYARVVSLTQAQYDALVQNDQVEHGVLYCIIEQSNS